MFSETTEDTLLGQQCLRPRLFYLSPPPYSLISAELGLLQKLTPIYDTTSETTNCKLSTMRYTNAAFFCTFKYHTSSYLNIHFYARQHCIQLWTVLLYHAFIFQALDQLAACTRASRYITDSQYLRHHSLPCSVIPNSFRHLQQWFTRRE